MARRGGPPRPPFDAVPVGFDDHGDVGGALGAGEFAEVPDALGEDRQVDGEVDAHQRVDEEFAAGGAHRELGVAELATQGGGDLPVHDAGPVRGGALSIGNGVEVGLGFGRPRGNGEGPEVPTDPIEGGEVLEDVGVADAVKGIDAEAETDDEPIDTIEGGDGGKAGHVFFGCPEAGFVAAQEDVGAAIDENDGIKAKVPHEVLVGGAQRPDPGAGEGVHYGWPAAGIEPPGEGPFGEVGIITRAAGTHGREAGGEPVVEIEPVEITEGEVGEVDIFAL